MIENQGFMSNSISKIKDYVTESKIDEKVAAKDFVLLETKLIGFEMTKTSKELLGRSR